MGPVQAEAPAGAPTVRARILERLKAAGVPFETLTHPPVASCEDSACHRSAAGWAGVGSKCILFHAKGRFYLVVTTADREIKARRFKQPFGTKDIRFATPEEVRRETGCAVGSVPPFGHDGEGLQIFVDERIFEAGHFMFNPAVPTESVRIPAEGLRRVYAGGPDTVTVFLPDAEGRLEFTPL
jgi:Ala-tRNA(Pro) deacylase